MVPPVHAQLSVTAGQLARLAVPAVILTATTDVRIALPAGSEARARLRLASTCLACTAGELVAACDRAVAVLAAEVPARNALAVRFLVARPFVSTRDEAATDRIRFNDGQQEGQKHRQRGARSMGGQHSSYRKVEGADSLLQDFLLVDGA